MTFNTWTFSILLVLSLVAYYSISSWTARKVLLLLVSYLFYASWNPIFVLLLIGSTTVDWLAGKALGFVEQPSVRRTILGASLVVNFGLLGVFKYGQFLTDSAVQLLSAAGIKFAPIYWGLILPVGISFYTFQSVSYVVDVYRRRKRAEASYLHFALYVTFFPQLVAGPIVRSGEFLPQLNYPKKLDPRLISDGLFLFLIGLGMKNAADMFFAPFSDSIFTGDEKISAISAWIGAFSFSGQIYCDFAGYSICAIGVALCFGFVLPENFRYPYAALGFSDFWRRWHISLSTWLRDYLYISLGGNRRGLARTCLNILITMLLGGLWHGAAWTFVIWGALHGALLCIEHALRRLVTKLGIIASDPLSRLCLWAVTFLFVNIAWVLFRSPTLARATTVFKSMFLLDGAAPGIAEQDKFALVPALAIAMLLAFQWFMRDKSGLQSAVSLKSANKAVLSGILMFWLFVSVGDDRTFIYFQF